MQNINIDVPGSVRDQNRWRSRIMVLLACGYLGTGAELWLLDHMEGFWQKVPLGLVMIGLLGLAVQSLGRCAYRFFQAAMVLSIVGGAVGMFLHFDGNLEFERELNPSVQGAAMVWNTLKGATPALAPGMMILLGMLGLATAAPNYRALKHEQPIP